MWSKLPLPAPVPPLRLRRSRTGTGPGALVNSGSVTPLLGDQEDGSHQGQDGTQDIESSGTGAAGGGELEAARSRVRQLKCSSFNGQRLILRFGKHGIFYVNYRVIFSRYQDACFLHIILVDMLFILCHISPGQHRPQMIPFLVLIFRIFIRF